MPPAFPPTWPRSGRLTAATDPHSNVTAYAYDDFGRVAFTTNPLGHVVGYEYDADGNLVELERSDDWTPRFCFGATKSFDFKNYNDRISVTGEFYYDHDGYDDNLLDENTRAAFLDGGYYQANYYGKYYAALFTTVAKFFSSDVTLNMNAIANVSDSSWLLMPGIVYEITNNATLSLDLTGHFGEDGREYTFGGQAVDLQFRVDLAF